MTRPERLRELLFADIALSLGVVDAGRAAGVLQRYWEGEGAGGGVADAFERAGALDAAQRARVEEEFTRLVERADGDAGVALARRGGADPSLHASLKPETSAALLEAGAGLRAPLRPVAPERYSDFTLVGKGGMGVVYLALDTELNRRVAFKIVRPDPHAPKEARAPETPLAVTPPSRGEESARSFEELTVRFLQEAWVTGAMEHPGVVPVYELGRTDAGIPFYTMRYVKGERTLEDAIREADDLDQRLGLLETFLKVCDTVRYAHARGVVHRDLKPENVALGEFGEVIVLDWGLSKMQGHPDVSGSLWRSRIAEFRDAADLQTVAGALGTPGYMAPEAALGKSEEVDAASDVYSLGAILFQILTGRLPYRFSTFMEYVQKTLEEPAPAVHEIEPGVPAELSEACARALAKGKEERFASVDEMAEAVRRWQTEGRLRRQVDELVDRARAEVEAARQHGGNTRLWHLDRATAACTRALHLRRDHEAARTLLAEIKELRDQGIRERVRSGRRRVILGVGFALLAVATIVTLAVASSFADQRAEARAQIRRERERLAAKEREVRLARQAAADATARRADLYAALSRELLAGDWVAGARVAAAQAAAVAPTRAAWRALAAAEARPAPTLVAMAPGLEGPVLFAPDGRRLYAGAPDGSVSAFDLVRREAGPVFRHGERVERIAVSPDGRRLCTVARDTRPRVWDAATGALVTELPAADEPPLGTRNAIIMAGPVSVAAFSDDGTRILTGHSTGFLLEWSATDGSLLGSLAHYGPAIGAIVAQGGYVFVGDAKGTVSRRLAERLTTEISYDTEAGAIARLVPSEGGDVVYACTRDRVLLLELEPDISLLNHYEGAAGTFTEALPTPDLQRMVRAAGDAAEVWSIPARARETRIAGPVEPITDLALGPDGALLAVARRDGGVRVWDLAQGWRTDGVEPASAVAASPDGGTAYLARPDFAIEVWDNHRRRSVARLGGHPATVTALAADDRGLYSASIDGTLRIWRGEGPGLVPVASFRGPDGPTALAPVPGTDLLCVGGLDGAVELWSEARRRRLARFEEPFGSPVVAVAVAQGRVAARAHDGAYREWDLETRRPVEAGPAPLLAGRPAPPETTAPVHGAPDPWVAQEPLRRLIAAENRYALRVDGARVAPVPPDAYAPHRPRLDPWSR